MKNKALVFGLVGVVMACSTNNATQQERNIFPNYSPQDTIAVPEDTLVAKSRKIAQYVFEKREVPMIKYGQEWEADIDGINTQTGEFSGITYLERSVEIDRGNRRYSLEIGHNLDKVPPEPISVRINLVDKVSKNSLTCWDRFGLDGNPMVSFSSPLLQGELYLGDYETGKLSPSDKLRFSIVCNKLMDDILSVYEKPNRKQ